MNRKLAFKEPLIICFDSTQNVRNFKWSFDFLVEILLIFWRHMTKSASIFLTSNKWTQIVLWVDSEDWAVKTIKLIFGKFFWTLADLKHNFANSKSVLVKIVSPSLLLQPKQSG